MDSLQHIDRVRPVRRGRGLLAGSLVVFSLLSWTTRCQAQEGQFPPARAGTVPTLEALPHNPLPPGRFVGWCGDRTVMEQEDRRREIYQGGVKASPLSFPLKSTLECGDDGQELVFVDEEAGLVSEVDLVAGVVTRTLATYDKQLTQEISFSPDMKSVASREPLTLASDAVKLNMIALSGSGRRAIGLVRWSRDSSELFGTSAPEGKANYGIVEILNAQQQRVGSGALPAGFLFRDGWFANSQMLYLYLVPARDEFGAGVVLKCRIKNWKCEQVATNVLEASAGGDGILGMVRAIGKYSNDGETETFPPQYLVEIRNRASRVVARQTFKSGERDSFDLAVAPSGMKVVLTWFAKSAPGCPPEKQANSTCKDGIMIDLSGRLK